MIQKLGNELDFDQNDENSIQINENQIAFQTNRRSGDS